MESLLVLTIGQAPRHDLVTELTDALGGPGPGPRPIEVRGALDGLSLDEITSLVTVADADALHTRLPGDVDVVVSK